MSNGPLLVKIDNKIFQEVTCTIERLGIASESPLFPIVWRELMTLSTNVRDRTIEWVHSDDGRVTAVLTARASKGQDALDRLICLAGAFINTRGYLEEQHKCIETFADLYALKLPWKVEDE